MQLINTIELSPYDYADKEYEFPDGSSAEFPEEWNSYWLTGISDSGLGHLKAIRKGSYLVDITTISDDELEIILKKELNKIDPDDFEEQVGCLCGGIVVKEQDTFLIEPMCCGDIGNIRNWESIFTINSGDWIQLWIGHPQVFYRINDGIIEFSDYTDLNPEQLTESSGVLKLSEIELKTELQKIITQQTDFERRIRKTLDYMGIQHAARIAALMTGKG